MSPRLYARGIVLVAAGAAVVLAVAVAADPRLRRRAAGLFGRSAPAPQQPTHIVLPDRVPESTWPELDEAVEQGREIGSGDVALTGA